LSYNDRGTNRSWTEKAWDYTKSLWDILKPEVTIEVTPGGTPTTSAAVPYQMDPTVKYMVIALVALVGYKVFLD